MPFHYTAQSHSGFKIIAVIFKRFFHRFANRLKARKMYNAAYIVLCKKLIQFISVTHIKLIEGKILPRKFLNPVYSFYMAV